jgi:hypothetical protein
MSLEEINSYLQKRLKKEKLEKVQATEAARWLDEEGLLEDDPKRPGRILRKYLGKEVLGARKEKNRWLIYPVQTSPKRASKKTRLKEKSKVAEPRGKPSDKAEPKEKKETPVTRKKPSEKAMLKDKKNIETESDKKPVKTARKTKGDDKGIKEDQKLADSLEQCYRDITDQKTLAGLLKNDPVALIVRVRDLAKAGVIQIAGSQLEDYDDSLSYIDTITALYRKRAIRKLTVQCLHTIRKLGNLAVFETDELVNCNSSAAAKIAASCLIIFFEETRANKLIS